MYRNYSVKAAVYQPYKEKDGTVQLKKVGDTNVDAAIQSHRDEVDMYQILKKAQVTGDFSKVKGNAGVYADIADYPRSFNEAQKLINKMPKAIANLPDEVKAAFNGYEDFITAVANGSVQSRLIDYQNKLQQQKVEVTAE